MTLHPGVQRRSKRRVPRGDRGTDGIGWSHTISPLQVSSFCLELFSQYLKYCQYFELLSLMALSGATQSHLFRFHISFLVNIV